MRIKGDVDYCVALITLEHCQTLGACKLKLAFNILGRLKTNEGVMVLVGRDDILRLRTTPLMDRILAYFRLYGFRLPTKRAKMLLGSVVGHVVGNSFDKVCYQQPGHYLNDGTGLGMWTGKALSDSRDSQLVLTFLAVVAVHVTSHCPRLNSCYGAMQFRNVSMRRHDTFLTLSSRLHRKNNRSQHPTRGEI